MRIVLARHAKAEDGEGKPDAERRLTKEGREQASILGKFLEATLGEVDEVWSSPLPRAFETAEIAAKKIGPKVREEPLLAPGGDLDQLRWKLSQLDKSVVMLVGHQPDLGILASGMLGIRSPIMIKKSGLCILDTKDARKDDASTVATLNPKQYQDILDRKEYAPWMIRKQLI